MKTRKNDAYSPNQVLLAVFLAVAVAAIFTGPSLWIPASRIVNLHVRAIALAVADAIASLSAETRVESLVPAAREVFLSITGLADEPDWDTRYFNRRNGAPTARAKAVSAVQDLPITEGESLSADTGLGESAATTEYGLDGSGPSVVAESPVLPPVPAVPSRTVSSIHSSANPLKIYMFGDSQVYSLGNGLSRLVGNDSPIQVEFLAVHSSGFIRADYYDWPAKLVDTLNANRVDAVAMMLGMNDYQNFWDDQGRIMKKHTPEWEAAYAEKCAALIDTALLYVPRVYWIGMPRVKDPQYEESLQYIEAVQDRIAAGYGPDLVIRCPIADSLPGSNGEYLANVTLPSGKILQAMSSDGNHFTVEGGQFAMEGLFGRLVKDWLFSEIPVEHLPE